MFALQCLMISAINFITGHWHLELITDECWSICGLPGTDHGGRWYGVARVGPAVMYPGSLLVNRRGVSSEVWALQQVQCKIK